MDPEIEDWTPNLLRKIYDGFVSKSVFYFIQETFNFNVKL